ncbi:MAG: TIR domain-containing protein [Planctomycetota bacterium]
MPNLDRIGMAYEQHVFISYAVLDNQPIQASQEGWITRFHQSLEAMLSMRLGDKAKVWRDEQELAGDHVLTNEIKYQIGRSAILVSVISPRYLRSKWCNLEIDEFCRQAQATSGVIVDNRSRVIKVLKTPIETLDVLPEVVRDILGYDFFRYHDDGTPFELDPDYGRQYAEQYFQMIGKLAWELSKSIDALDGVLEKKTNQMTIYLAATSYDRKKEREVLEGVLRHHGYRVLPDQPLPRNEEEYIEHTSELMEQSDLSIHLVGEHYGLVPDGPTLRSETMIQNEIGASVCRTKELSRIIWVPEGTAENVQADSPQGKFISRLNHDRDSQLGADVVTGNFEALKQCVHAAISKIEAKSVQPEKVDDKPELQKLIYLLCIEKDRRATVPLRRLLLDKGYQVQIPAFQGEDAAKIRETHRQLLLSCDGVILFYGDGDEAWKRTMANELIKLPGYRETPLRASCTLLAPPTTIDKEEMILLGENSLIDSRNGFSEAGLEPFLQELEAGSHGER